MAIEARFVHVNLVAKDWRRLARFYEQVQCRLRGDFTGSGWRWQQLCPEPDSKGHT
jgi:predicted enzyme related to lactoylglutathione lyase